MPSPQLRLGYRIDEFSQDNLPVMAVRLEDTDFEVGRAYVAKPLGSKDSNYVIMLRMGVLDKPFSTVSSLGPEQDVAGRMYDGLVSAVEFKWGIDNASRSSRPAESA